MQGSAIPADGKFMVTFPSAYTLTGVTSCASYVVGGYATIDGTFSVSTSGNDVTCTRANDGTATSAGGSHAITVETIGNPTSGGTQTFAFATLDSSDATIDQGSGATIEITDEAALNLSHLASVSLFVSGRQAGEFQLRMQDWRLIR